MLWFRVLSKNNSFHSGFKKDRLKHFFLPYIQTKCSRYVQLQITGQVSACHPSLCTAGALRTVNVRLPGLCLCALNFTVMHTNSF